MELFVTYWMQVNHKFYTLNGYKFTITNLHLFELMSYLIVYYNGRWNFMKYFQ